MKRFLLSCLLAVAGLACAWAQEYDFEVDGMYYNVTDEAASEVEVTSRMGGMGGGGDPDAHFGDLVVPDSVLYAGKTYRVTRIGDWAFNFCSGLTSVTLPDGLTSIGEQAFSECSGMTSVNIPAGVTSIGHGAFMGCSSLASVTLPDGLTDIGESAFEWSGLYQDASRWEDGVLYIGPYLLDAKEEKDKASITLVTSFNPGSGKTFLTMNMAATFALKGKRVLVIDGDLRRGSASAYIDSPKKGLSDYLGHRIDDIAMVIADVEDFPALHILPVGTIPPNPTELLADIHFNQLIADLRTRYDYIFIDCPPIDIVADTQIISKLVDHTVFVVRAGLLERDMLPELQRLYDERRFPAMALVLNGTEATHSRYAYRYGYYNSYNYNYVSSK